MLRMLLVLMLCLAGAEQLEAGIWDTFRSLIWGKTTLSPKINVLIVHDKPSVMVEVDGKYCLHDPNTDTHLGTRYMEKRQVFESSPDGLCWGEEFTCLYQLEIIPGTTSTQILVDGIEYKGSIYIYDIGGTISVVNQLGLDDYLVSILGLQYDNPAPDELLAAVALVERTNALYQVQHPKNTYWTVDGHRVGYRGYVPSFYELPIAQAVHETRKMILSEGSEEELTPFPAQWGSISGGRVSQTYAVVSDISLYEAETMADTGVNAGKIVSRAFPSSRITLIP